MALVHSGFHAQKDFRKLPAIWGRALKNIRQPCSRTKNVKNVDLKSAKLFVGPGRPGWAQRIRRTLLFVVCLRTETDSVPEV